MRLTLKNKKSEVPGVESFRFIPTEPLSWRAGQFLHYVLHHEPTDDRGSDRWFTVASAPFEKEVMVTTRIAGEKGSSFKGALQALKIGEQIEISDIDGDFVVEDTEKEYVFLAGGIGITPFHSILKEADHKGEKLKVNLLYGNRDENIPYKDELEKFANNNSRLAIHYIISPEKIDAGVIKKFVRDIQKPLFYLSGPEPMVISLEKMLENIGVPANHIVQDQFPGYSAQ